MTNFDVPVGNDKTRTSSPPLCGPLSGQKRLYVELLSLAKLQSNHVAAGESEAADDRAGGRGTG